MLDLDHDVYIGSNLYNKKTITAVAVDNQTKRYYFVDSLYNRLSHFGLYGDDLRTVTYFDKRKN